MAYSPTVNLRFVERTEFVRTDADGNLLVHDVVRAVTCRVLQQQWISSFIGEADEWRDVPLIAELAHAP
jgi:hypothetical protein